MQSISIGRQPILDENLDLCAYEVLYRGSEVALNRYTSASIINNVLNKFGRTALLGDRRAFVKIDAKFLLHDIIFSIPNNFFIFSILPEVELNDKVIQRVATLQEKGFAISIDTLVLDEIYMKKYISVFTYLRYIKIDIEKSSYDCLQKNIKTIKSNDIIIVADNVDNLEQYEEAKIVGCDWFQGYFFAEPKIVENVKYEPSHISILKLYNLIMQDVNIDEITKEFENNHEITIQLLQFINSGAFHFVNKISSIHHVLTLVGRMPLGQWLMLMIYSKSVSKEGESPLMLMVKNRTFLMEEILTIVEPSVKSNMLGEAYFVGVLSLIDTIYGVKLETILAQMNISEEVQEALLNSQGILGEILALIKKIEVFNPDAVYEFEKKHNLKIGSIEKILIQSMKDLNEFEKLVS